MEVESVIREVSEAVLYDTGIGKETQRLRAQALGIVGEIYMGVKKDKEDKDAIGNGEDKDDLSKWILKLRKNAIKRLAVARGRPSESLHNHGSSHLLSLVLIYLQQQCVAMTIVAQLPCDVQNLD